MRIVNYLEQGGEDSELLRAGGEDIELRRAGG